MNIFKKLLVSLLLLPSLVLADQAYFDTNNRVFLVTKETQKMTIGTGGAGTFEIIYAGTPVANVDATGINPAEGFGITDNVYSVVVAATAVAGTNQLKPGMNIPGATATANHLALIGSATTIPGAKYEFYNASAASLKLKAPAGVTLNGATASGTLVVAAKISATCIVVSATDIDCRLNVNPTAAAA